MSSVPASRIRSRRTITDRIMVRLVLFSAIPIVMLSGFAVGIFWAVAGVDALQQSEVDITLAALALVSILAALIATMAFASRLVAQSLAREIAEPMQKLCNEAHRLADTELPDLVTSLRSIDGSGEIPVVEMIDIDADGEVAELVVAFNRLRATTVELAASQAIDHSKDMSRLLVNLGRRNQHLIGRQLQFIDELELIESDPDVLRNLFTLDQMATRMRRNAESLLVLAGEHITRRTVSSQPIEDVLRAATSEVEHYARVEIVSADPAQVQPTVVSDLTHLLAELIENAIGFSPYETAVEIFGHWDHLGCYTISVIDQGDGMSRAKLAEANAMIKQSILSDKGPSSHLGLFVVGRLAAIHEIDARLVESATVGTAAKVTLPARCVTAVPEPTGEIPSTEPTRSLPPAVQVPETSWQTPATSTPEIWRQPHRSTPIGPLPLLWASHRKYSVRRQKAAARTHFEPDDDQVTSELPALATGEGDGQDSIGLPIPPFRARQSKRPKPAGGSDDAMGQPEPPSSDHDDGQDNEQDLESDAGEGSNRLELVTPSSGTETSGVARAVEVRDRLSQFVSGVAEAKAATLELRTELDSESDGDSVLEFQPRVGATAAVSETETEED